MSLQLFSRVDAAAPAAHRDPHGTDDRVDRARRWIPFVLLALGLVGVLLAVRAGTGLHLHRAALVVAALVAAGWWTVAPEHRPAALNRWSVSAGAVAVVELVADGPTWQQSGWELLAGLTAASALWRMWRTDLSPAGRWAGGARRAVLVAAVLASTVLAQFALTPELPTPTGALHVGSEVFTWTDPSRPELMTATGGDPRQVVAQAWYPTDATSGPATRYVGAGDDTALVPGLPPGFFRRYDGQIDTHAHDMVPISTAHSRWPVLLFSPGLGVARQSYTALCTELASRGYVVVAMSHPYESPVTQLADGRQAPPHTFLPTTPAGLDAIARLVEIRAADSSFVLTQLGRLAATSPESPLAGHLDLARVGIFGHSLGGATAVRAIATDDRFRAGANLDGRLFGTVPELHRPFLWVQSEASRAGGDEHAATRATRDALMGRLAAGGALVTIAGSAHLSFSDAPAYLTPVGRTLLGRLPAAGIGPLAVADVAPITADLVTSVMGPAFVGQGGIELDAVTTRYRGVGVDRVVAERRVVT